jgi:hypothetical protein
VVIRALLAVGLLGLAACAPEVVRRATQFTPATDQPAVTLEVLKKVSIPVGPGYSRDIDRGSLWTRIGRTTEGDVFKPVDRVFTVEGAHIHEAYLVLEGDRVVGFYLPVERAFSPVPDGTQTHLSLRRRQP